MIRKSNHIDIKRYTHTHTLAVYYYQFIVDRAYKRTVKDVSYDRKVFPNWRGSRANEIIYNPCNDVRGILRYLVRRDISRICDVYVTIENTG